MVWEAEVVNADGDQAQVCCTVPPSMVMLKTLQPSIDRGTWLR